MKSNSRSLQFSRSASEIEDDSRYGYSQESQTEYRQIVGGEQRQRSYFITGI